MSDNTKPSAEMWDKRYGADTFAYGESPNAYFKEKLSQIKPGKLLLPAEGEGRNAAFALSLGWDVEAFDISKEGKLKAEKLAVDQPGTLNYQIKDALEISYPENSFDAVSFVYAHFPPDLRKTVYQKMLKALKPGGYIILEGFGRKQIEYQAHQKSGGPRNAEFLFSMEDMHSLFKGFEVLEMLEGEVQLQEGIYHQGQAWVLRFLGKKL